MSLSSTKRFAVLSVVVSPCTVKLPNTVKSAPLNDKAVFNEDVYEFMLLTDVFKLAVVVLIFETEVFKLAVVVFKFDIEVFADAVNVFWFVFAIAAALAELIKEPVTTPTSVNLVNTDALNSSKFVVSIIKLAVAEFKFVIEVACELLVDNAVDADAYNAVNLVFCVVLVVSFEPV